MKNWKVEVFPEAEKFLKRLDRKKRKLIISHLKEMENLQNPLLHPNVLPLTGKLKGFYRLRVGKYRIIFELLNKRKVIAVHIIASRGKIY